MKQNADNKRIRRGVTIGSHKQPMQPDLSKESAVLKRKNRKKGGEKRKISSDQYADDVSQTESIIAPPNLTKIPPSSCRKSETIPTFKQKLLSRLESSRFRYINEQLYTSSSVEAEDLFRNDSSSFKAYHEGYTNQVSKWPVNPLDIIIDDVRKMSKTTVIADMGCGDAKLSKSVPHKVYSFDLVKANELVTVCNIAKVPLGDGSVDVCVFCLSLMGVNFTDYLREANRILKMHGLLIIAEVTSRFKTTKQFAKGVCKLGFTLEKKCETNKFFVMFHFKKSGKANAKDVMISLKPCLYKKR